MQTKTLRLLDKNKRKNYSNKSSNKTSGMSS